MSERHFNMPSHNKLHELFVELTRILVLGIIAFTVVLLLGFSIMEVIDIAGDMFHDSTRNFLRDIAFVLVLVKAYRVLIFYFETMHVSIRYLIEISFVAPAIEIIFAYHDKPWWLIVLLTAFSALNLVVYLLFYDKIVEIDKETVGSVLERQSHRNN